MSRAQGRAIRVLVVDDQELIRAGLRGILRARFGFQWSVRQERLLTMLAAASRVGVPLLPGYLRLMPHARRAARRRVS